MMHRTDWKRLVAAGALGVGLAPTAVWSQAQPVQVQPAQAGQNQTAAQAGQVAQTLQNKDVPAPVDSIADVRDMLRMGFMVADANKDGQISQEEAVSAANIVVGGFFFRADANGDGSVTQDEARALREEILKNDPILRIVVEEAKRQAQNPQAGGNPQANAAIAQPLQFVGSLLDVDNNNQLKASEVRQGVQTVVAGLYATADTNRDGQMSPEEVNAAALGVAQAAGEIAFKSADANNDNQLDQQEFEQAVIGPARLVFGIVDANKDGRITAEENQRAQQILLSQAQRLVSSIPDAGGRLGPIPNLPAPDIANPGAAIPGRDPAVRPATVVPAGGAAPGAAIPR